MVKPFLVAHAMHPQWRMAAGLVAAQLKSQMQARAVERKKQSAASSSDVTQSLVGLLYFSDHFASDAQALLDDLRSELPQVKDWVGTVGVGICATAVEYFDEPALVVMLCEFPQGSYRVFNGITPIVPAGLQKSSGELPRSEGLQNALPHSALVHADGRTPDLADLISELAARTSSGYLFGGLASSRHAVPQIAAHANSEQSVFHGGLSGVAFEAGVGTRMISRVTQGCQPLRLPKALGGKPAQPHRITKSEGHVILELDGERALDVMLDELGISLQRPEHASHKLRQTLVGLMPESATASGLLSVSAGRFGQETRVRHLIGLDPLRRGIAIADMAPVGMRLTFCERHMQAARSDLMRICAEIREEVEEGETENIQPPTLFQAESSAQPGSKIGSIDAIQSVAIDAENVPAKGQRRSKKMLGAVYVSCAGRGGPHFGGDSAELQIIRHALGDVPLVGFFAGGEIAHQNLYGYTGVLTVFTD